MTLMSGSGSVEAVAAVAGRPDLGAEAFEAGVAQAQAGAARIPFLYLRDRPRELDEWLEL